MSNLVLSKLFEIKESLELLKKASSSANDTEQDTYLKEQKTALFELLPKTSSESEEINALISQGLLAIKPQKKPKTQQAQAKSEDMVNNVKNAYERLLPIARLIHLEEQNGIPEEHAWKLAVTFGGFDAALDYLARSMPPKGKETNQVLHDACMYALPEKAAKPDDLSKLEP